MRGFEAFTPRKTCLTCGGNAPDAWWQHGSAMPRRGRITGQPEPDGADPDIAKDAP